MRARSDPPNPTRGAPLTAPHTSFPRWDLNFFLTSEEKGTYLGGRAAPPMIGQPALVTVGPLLSPVSFKNLCPRPPSSLSFLPLSSLQAQILIPRPVPTSRTSCHLYRAQSKPQNNPFFASGTYC